MPTSAKTHRLNVNRHRQVDELRGNANQRGYGYDWQQLAKRYKEQNPFCEECLLKSVMKKGEELDHIIPFQGLNDPLRLDWSNLRHLCKRHHGLKTWRDRRRSEG